MEDPKVGRKDFGQTIKGHGQSVTGPDADKVSPTTQQRDS